MKWTWNRKTLCLDLFCEPCLSIHVRAESFLEVPLVSLQKNHGVGPRGARDVHEADHELLHHRIRVGAAHGGQDVVLRHAVTGLALQLEEKRELLARCAW